MSTKNILFPDDHDHDYNRTDERDKSHDHHKIVTLASTNSTTTVINLAQESATANRIDLVDSGFGQALAGAVGSGKSMADQEQQSIPFDRDLLPQISAGSAKLDHHHHHYATPAPNDNNIKPGDNNNRVDRNKSALATEATNILLNKATSFTATAAAEGALEKDDSWKFKTPGKEEAGSVVAGVGVKEGATTLNRLAAEGSLKSNILRECRLDEDTITKLKASSSNPDIQSEPTSIVTNRTPLPTNLEPATTTTTTAPLLPIQPQSSSSIIIDSIATHSSNDRRLINLPTTKSPNTHKTGPTALTTTSQSPSSTPTSQPFKSYHISASKSSPSNKSSNLPIEGERYKSLLAPNNHDDDDDRITSNKTSLSTKSTELNQQNNNCDNKEQFVLADLTKTNLNNQIIDEEDEEEEFEDGTYSDECEDFQPRISSPYDKRKKPNRSKSGWFLQNRLRTLYDKINIFQQQATSNNTKQFNLLKTFSSNQPSYKPHEDKDLLTGASKYRGSGRNNNNNNNNKRFNINRVGRTFRGSYRYSRIQITMAIFRKFAAMMLQKSTFSLIGACLIHITLGTVYTLSNINSYLTSYMREHGSPKATYGGSMWISSSYAVGQGFSMVLGGYIEKRFSARLACTLGCLLHSGSIMATSWSVNHGPLAVLLTYGFLPGFGCGLAYMTPMTNGFGWYPNRKGLVAGVILAGFGIGTFIFNMLQTAYVNPDNLSPPDDANGYFTQHSILDRVPHLFMFLGSIYAIMQFVGCCLLFKPPYYNLSTSANGGGSPSATSSKSTLMDCERPILIENEVSLRQAIKTREFMVLFLVYGITTQGVLFVNSMLKEYGQIFITSDMYLAWTGSMASIANSLGRLFWGLAIDRFSFTQCFTSITIIFGSLLFLMPFEFVLSSKVLYLVCTLGLFGSFSGWMSTYPVHLSRVFGRTNSGMIYGLIYISQSLGGIVTAFAAHYLIDHYNRFVPFFCIVLLEISGLAIYHLFYPM